MSSAFLVLANTLIGTADVLIGAADISIGAVNASTSTAAALYLTMRLTLQAFLTYFNCASIIPSTLRYLSGSFTSLGIIGSLDLITK